MAANYTKLFSSILSSSIWCEDAATKVVWVTLLAMADQHGEVQASMPGLARFAGVSLEEADRAMEVFMAPDEHSRTEDHEGRRVERIQGGYRLLNHAHYRHLGSADQKREADRERQRRRRAGEAAIDSADEPTPKPKLPAPTKPKKQKVTLAQATSVATQHPIIGQVKGAVEAVGQWQQELESARKLWATVAALGKHLDNIAQHPPEVALLAIEYAAANQHTTIAGGLKEALAQQQVSHDSAGRKGPRAYTDRRCDGTRPGEYSEEAPRWSVG